MPLDLSKPHTRTRATEQVGAHLPRRRSLHPCEQLRRYPHEIAEQRHRRFGVFLGQVIPAAATAPPYFETRSKDLERLAKEIARENDDKY